ncbi:MAG: ABC transporter permease [Planctomycetes bacterium]|nr:ABC transporter permease [Planctomycetota bacterium]
MERSIGFSGTDREHRECVYIMSNFEPPVWHDGGSAAHILGTDKLGRDVWARLVFGTRISMTIGLVGVAVALILGVSLGGISGYYGGLADTVIQRFIEIIRSIPTIPLWIALAGLLTWLRAGDERVLRGPVVMTLVLWWIAQCVLALVGPSQSMRYWQATWPPMLWLAVAGLNTAGQLFRRGGGAHRPALVLAALTGTWLLGGSMYDQYRHGLASAYVAHLDEPNERTRLREGSEQIRELVPPGHTIYVWSYDVGWYVHAQRQAACRYTYPRSVDQMEEILQSLEAAKPEAVLVPSGRARGFDEWCDDSCHERVAAALAGYAAQTTVGPYTVWVRRERPAI